MRRAIRLGAGGGVGLAVLLLLFAPVQAQGPGFFLAAPGTGRPQCTSITNPVTNQTWCADGNPAYAWRVWDGTQYVPITGGGGGTLTGSGTANTVAKWSGSTSLTNSNITDTGALITLLGPSVTLSNSTSFSYPAQASTSGENCVQINTAGLITNTGLPCGTGFSGEVTISGTATTATVTFPSPQADTTYAVTLGTRPLTGTPPAVLARYTTKTVNGFTVEITSAPGAGNSIDVDWQVGTGTPATGVNGSGVAGQITVWSSGNAITGFTDLTFASHIMTVASGTSLVFNGGSGGAIGFTGPTTVATPVTWKLPTGDGSAGTCLSTNGSAVLGWANCSSGGTGLTSLNGQTGATQTFSTVNDTNVTLSIGSAANVHTFTMGWTGTTSPTRGGTGLNTSASTGVAQVTSGTWSISSISSILGTANRTRMCTVVTGDPATSSPVLVDGNDAPVACGNDYGADWTITSVACWADAGSPTVTPILTGGSGTSILTGALTCGTAAWAAGTLNGSPVVHSFSGGGATCSSTPCSMDVNITTAGGTARYIVVKISGTLP